MSILPGWGATSGVWLIAGFCDADRVHGSSEPQPVDPPHHRRGNHLRHRCRGRRRFPLVGFTSLAEGADQLFAFAVLAAGGEVHAVIPSQGYEQGFTSESARDTYTALLSLATDTTTMSFAAPSEDAYLAAGHEVAERSEILFAIWDGKGAAGKGGTGDVVAYARERGLEVRIIWPDGASRDSA